MNGPFLVVQIGHNLFMLTTQLADTYKSPCACMLEE